MEKRETASPGRGVTASPAYKAATRGAAAMWRQDRDLLTLGGRSPGEMLRGILSGRIPAPPTASGEGWSEGEAAYSTILTPKGKMVSDLRLLTQPTGRFLMDLPKAGLQGALRHFGKYLNPRFAEIADCSDELGLLTVMGPEAPGMVSTALGYPVPVPGEGRVLVYSPEGGPELTLLGNWEIRPPSMDLLLPLGVLSEIWSRLRELGVHPMDDASWEILRIERGTPLFGVDMSEDMLPIEAGIHERAIDHGKGCYIGQEVVVRIRDRGRINKSLRRVFLGDAPVPSPGTDLFIPEDTPSPTVDVQPGSSSRQGHPEGAGTLGGKEKKAGWTTSACKSPRFGQTVALGLVRREVEEGGAVRLGGPRGVLGRVGALDWDGDAGT
jgi:folate-binding protein YgfZ